MMLGAPSTHVYACNGNAKINGGNRRTASSSSSSSALSLPPWMKFHHLPERGVISNSIPLTYSHNDSKMAAVLGSTEEEVAKKSAATTTTTTRLSRRRLRGSIGVAGGNETIPLTTASNYKTKKDIALDSIYPPTLQEVHGHSRYLSECAMRIAMGEVEKCVTYSLRYSWNEDNVSNDTTTTVNQKGGVKGDNSHHQTTLASEIHRFFDMFQPLDIEDHDIQIQTDHGDRRQEYHDDVNNINLYDMLCPERYNPLLLPVAVVKCHSNVLDRAEVTKGLMSDLSKRSKTMATTAIDGHQKQHYPHQRIPCVCVIRSTSDLVRKGRIIAELLSQCIKNDHVHGESFAIELQRMRKRRKSHRYGGVNNGVLVRSIWSWSQSLVDWASYTESFDSIIVILEDPEEISSPTLDLFFTTLSSLRSGKEDDDGVPISVVVMDASPGGLGDRLSKLCRPAFRGGTAGGTVMRELHVPPPQHQWGKSSSA
jgi:hypothetical protein